MFASPPAKLTVSNNYENFPIVHFAYRFLSLFSALRRRFHYILTPTPPSFSSHLSPARIRPFRFRIFHVRLYIPRACVECDPTLRRNDRVNIFDSANIRTRLLQWRFRRRCRHHVGGKRGDREWSEDDSRERWCYCRIARGNGVAAKYF